MLTEQRRWKCDSPWGVGQFDRNARDSHCTGLGVLDRDDHVTSDDLRIFADLAHRLNFATRNPGSQQEFDPLLGGFFQHDGLYKAAQGPAALHALGIGTEALVVGPALVASRLTEGTPHAIIPTGEVDVAVLTAVRFVRGNGRVLIAHAGWALASSEIDAGLVGQHGDLAVEHAEVDLLTTARLVTREQC